MNVQKNYTSIEQIRNQYAASAANKKSTDAAPSQTFASVFQDTSEQLKFSKHATERLQTRNIDMSQEQRERLQDATIQAREKGMRESLVMVDDLAFIVNVKNNTVITAVGDTKQAVFTNIDGAIIN